MTTVVMCDSGASGRYDDRTLKYFFSSAAVVVLLVLPGCPSSPPSQPSRERLRVVMPASYRLKVEALLSSGVMEFSLGTEDIDWVDLPVYSGRDAVFAPSMAARLPTSEPDADVYFIDLYRLGTFRAEWLSPFSGGIFHELETTYRPDFLSAARLDGNRVYAIPWSAKGNFLFYRRDLVEKPPSNWDEVRSSCAKLVAKGLPRQLRYCLLVHWDTIQNDLYPMLWGLTEQGDINISAPVVRTFLETMAGSLGEELSGGFLMMPRAEDMPEVGTKIYRRFAGGEAVYAITWNNRLGFMQEALQKVGGTLPPLGIAPIPAPRVGDTQYSNSGPWGWIVPSIAQESTAVGQKRHDLAMKFVAEVTSQPAVEWLVNTYGIIPARKDVALSDEMKEVLSPPIQAALDGEPTSMRFRDRGSDSFIHGFIRDAVRDVLMCRTAAIKPLPSGLLGDCARHFEECSASADLSVDCLTEAIRRRLMAAQRNIEITRGAR